MARRTLKRISVSITLGLVFVFAAACNLPIAQQPVIQGNSGLTPVNPANAGTPLPPSLEPATATLEAATATFTLQPIVHLVTPGDPPSAFESRIMDHDSSSLAAEHRTNGGENYNLNLFERPFDQSMNTYFPNLDIKNAALNRDSLWVYVTISLVGPVQPANPAGDYGAEFDLNIDGRGDYLVMASDLKPGWTTDGLWAWQDPNHDVGGIHPLQSDAPQHGDGYEVQLFNQGQGSDPDVAWARVSPLSPNSVQIALKRTLIQDSGHFLWGAWTMAPAMLHPDWFDYNDRYTQAEAGSPLLELTQYYPPKALFELDNTCRWAVGFTPIGTEPGVCPVPPTPTPKPTSTPKPTVTLDCTQYKDRQTCDAHPACAWVPVGGITQHLFHCVNQ
jgi:hypothetical protein